jgi:uncharacterized protein (TIGR02271 family)
MADEHTHENEAIHSHPDGDQPHTHDDLPVTDGDELETLQLREEELVAQKQAVETGHVQVNKDVVTEHRTLDVPVSREEIYVERRPVDRQPTTEPIGAESATVEVVAHEEQVDVEKRPVVYEEVEVGKRAVQETRRVEGDVQREEVEVHEEGSLHEHR